MKGCEDLMKLDIIISADDIKNEKVKDKTVVVIDILRATSVIITAINNGCTQVIPTLTVEEALKIANKDRSSCVLGGERNAVKIGGFDFSNSPLEYKDKLIKGKKLVMTTTNGTRAIKRSVLAKNILIGAMINASAVSKKVIELNNDVVIVNSGTYGQFSIDDFACSGYILNCILKLKEDVELADIAKTALYIYKQNDKIKDFIKHANHYKKLKQLHLEDDLNYCCKKDIIDLVPEYKNGIIGVFKDEEYKKIC